MRSEPTSLSLVLPAYNTGRLLHATLDRALAWREARSEPTEIVVVDDGSTDDTGAILATYAGRPGLRTLSWSPNRGKGGAVKGGMLAATGTRRVFLDAGLTYPLENVDRVVAALDDGADVAIGSRVHRASRYVVAPSAFRRLYSRHLMGRTFNALVRTLVLRGVRDTQVGLKGMTASAAVAVFGRAKVDHFAFDVEILGLARKLGLRIAEVPVLFVYEEEPSTLRLFRDGLRMIADVVRTRRRLREEPSDQGDPGGPVRSS